jgi:hypothetical protein
MRNICASPQEKVQIVEMIVPQAFNILNESLRDQDPSH